MTKENPKNCQLCIVVVKTICKAIWRKPPITSALDRNADRCSRLSICTSWARDWRFLKVSPHCHAWDMWTGAASLPLTRLGTRWGHFPRVYTTLRDQEMGIWWIQLPSVRAGSAFMNVAFEWREASRHPDSLYFTVCGKWAWCDFKRPQRCYYAIPQPFLSHKEGVSTDLLFSHYITHGMVWTNSCLYFSWPISERQKLNYCDRFLLLYRLLYWENNVKNQEALKTHGF